MGDFDSILIFPGLEQYFKLCQFSQKGKQSSIIKITATESLIRVMNNNPAKTYQNVMELLVAKEVNRQINKIAVNLRNYIDPVEVATYALNRLPPLYASSEKGRHKQKLQGEQKFKEQIATAVRQGIVAVQRDPLRVSVPLTVESEMECQSAFTALQELRELLLKHNLLRRELTWENLTTVVEQVINQTGQHPPTLSDRKNLANQFHDWQDQQHYQR
jgi:Late competence development protein ComFB